MNIPIISVITLIIDITIVSIITLIIDITIVSKLLDDFYHHAI